MPITGNFRKPEFWALVLAALLAGVMSFLYLTHWRVGFDSDYALTALLARHILKYGESAVFLFDVNYQGMLLEANAVALSYRVFGITPFALNLPNTLFYLAVLLALYKAVHLEFGKRVAAFSVLFFTAISPLMGEYLLRTYPNYTELFLIGLLIFICYRNALSGRRVLVSLALLGFLLGFGLYINTQLIYFPFALLAHLFLLKVNRGLAAGASAWDLIFPGVGSSHLGVRWALRLLHALNGINFLIGLCSLVPWVARTLHASPVVSLMLSFKLFIVFQLIATVIEKRTLLRRRVLWVLSSFMSFLIGVSPKLYGVWILGIPFAARTGMDGDVNAIVNRLRIIGYAISRFLNLNFGFLALGGGLASLVLLAAFLASQFRGQLRRNVPSLFPLLALGVILAFLASNNSTDITRIRYLAPLFLVIACSLGYGISVLWSRGGRSRSVALVLTALILSGNGWALCERFRNAEEALPQEQLVSWLGLQGVTRGYANYWFAYSSVHLSNEEIILEPVMDGYIRRYRLSADGQKRIAYVDRRPPVFGAGPEFTIKGIRYRTVAQKPFGDTTASILERIGP